jgi:Family of unknown function (DUF5670)
MRAIVHAGGNSAVHLRFDPHLETGRSSMFLALFFVFLVCWVFGFVVFHVAGGLIHALLIVAAISLIWHFVRGRSTV